MESLTILQIMNGAQNDIHIWQRIFDIFPINLIDAQKTQQANDHVAAQRFESNRRTQ